MQQLNLNELEFDDTLYRLAAIKNRVLCYTAMKKRFHLAVKPILQTEISIGEQISNVATH